LKHSVIAGGNRPDLPVISLCDIERFRRVDLRRVAIYAETPGIVPSVFGPRGSDYGDY